MRNWAKFITYIILQSIILVVLFPPGATVSLNETNIVVPEGDYSNTTVDICVVLANDMEGLQRNVVVNLTMMPETANS